MFGIGFSELIFILFVILMLFGSDKIPDIARTLGKAMNQIKHATNDIKTEIQKSASENGFDKDSLTGGISTEIEKIKSDLVNTTKIDIQNPITEVQKTTNKVQKDLEDLTGPIKRQM
jgi:sec-independent protein translocase protein TatA